MELFKPTELKVLPKMPGTELRDCCETCKFSLEENGNLFCRRMPPTVFIVAPMPRLQTQSVSPCVQKGSWCGEFFTRLVV